MNLTIFKNRKGFALAEVLVAAGMLGIVSLGLMKMTEQQNKSAKKMRSDFNTRTLIFELSVIQKNAEACRNTLNTVAGLNLNTLPVNLSIKNQDDNDLLVNGQVYGSGSGGAVTVQSIQVTNANPVIGSGGLSTLTITIQMIRNGVDGPSANFQETLTLDFNDNDANGLINFAGGDTCVIQSVQTSLICEALGGVIVTDGTGQERCANIDLFNNEGDATTAGASRYFGVMARGGIGITEDTSAPGTGNVDKYWSITPTDTVNSRLQFRVDTSNQPNGTNSPLLELVSRTDGSVTTNITNTETHYFNDDDGTQRMMIGSNGHVSIGTAAIPNAMMRVEVNDLTTDDGIFLRTKVNNADIYLDASGAISAERNLYINMDADSSTTNSKIQIGKDAKGNGSTNLLTILEGGNVGINTTSPPTKLELVSSTGLGLRVRSENNSGSPEVRFQNDDQNWGIKINGATDAFRLRSNTLNERAIQIDKADNGVMIGHSGLTYAAGALDVYGGHIYLYQTSDAIGRPTTNDCQTGTPGNENCRVVHKGWVHSTIAGTLATDMTTAQREDIVEHLLNTTTTGNWAALKADALNDITATYDGALTGGGACPAGLFVERIRYYTDGRIRFDCGNPLGCGTKSNCTNVYAGAGSAGRVCMRNSSGNWKCISHGQKTWPNNCSIVNSGTGHNSARTAACTGDKMIRNLVYLSNGRVTVTCCNNESTSDE